MIGALIKAGPRDAWGMLAHALELALTPAHVTVVGPGVAVRLDVATGDHVALVHGGIRGHVDQAAVERSARANLEHWPVLIHRMEIIVTERGGDLDGRASVEASRAKGPLDELALARARAKRARKATRWKGSN